MYIVVEYSKSVAMQSVKRPVDNRQVRCVLNKPRKRDTIAMRAKRVDWQKVDDILTRVPARAPIPGDEAD
jgi:hypothetical protein